MFTGFKNREESALYLAEQQKCIFKLNKKINNVSEMVLFYSITKQGFLLMLRFCQLSRFFQMSDYFGTVAKCQFSYSYSRGLLFKYFLTTPTSA